MFFVHVHKRRYFLLMGIANTPGSRATVIPFRHVHGFEAGVGEKVPISARRRRAKIFEILLHQTSILLHQKFMFLLHQKQVEGVKNA